MQDATNQTLTANERKVLVGIDASEYGDDLQDSVWLFSVRDRSNVRGLTLSGTVASLVKKGLVKVAGGSRPLTSDTNADRDHEIRITDAGVAALTASGYVPKKAVRS